MSRCGEGSLTRTGDDVAQVAVQRCKCASCPDCAPGYRRRVSNVAASADPRLLITFTAPPGKDATPASQARDFVVHIRAFRRWWNKRHPNQRIEWFWVIEKHKSGWPHMHVLATNAFLPIKLLRVWMFRRMRSRMTSVERIRNRRGAANYVAKYLGKDPAKFSGTARWARSRKYGEPMVKVERFPQLADEKWIRSKESAASVVRRLVARNWHIDPTVKWCNILHREPLARALC